MAVADVVALEPHLLAAMLGRPVDAVEAKRIGTDRGFAGTVLLVTVRSAGRRPETVVAKLGPDPTLDREIVFYRDLAGELDAPAPRVRYAGATPDHRPVLLLEDLTASRPGDALTGAGVDDVAAVLARMAPVWRRSSIDPPLPAWGGDAEGRQQRYRRNWAAQRQALSAELPEDMARLGDRLCDSLAATVRILQQAVRNPVHADLHLDNVLFADAPDGRPHPVVLDWGSLASGPAEIDIFPFLAMSLDPGDHARHAADLLAGLELGRAVDVDDGCRRLLCAFAGHVGWRNRSPHGHPRERALRAAGFGDGRLVNALRQWDAWRVL